MLNKVKLHPTFRERERERERERAVLESKLTDRKSNWEWG